MKLFNLKKDDRDITVAQSVSDNGEMIQMIQAQVIEVGPEVTDENIDEEAIKAELDDNKKAKNKKKKYKPIRFSYRYKFTNPETGETVTAYDDLSTVTVGEQIYDVGETLYILYSNEPNKESGQDFTVTRKIVFPEIIQKKKQKMRIVKIIYWIILLGLIFFCMCSSVTQQEIVNNADLTTEKITEIEELLDINE